MTLTNEKGLIPLFYDYGIERSGGVITFSASGVMDATAEKVAFVGSVWHPTVKTGTINIRKVHFRCGAIAINANSEVRCSLQNVSATAGPPYQPDGTQDQTYDFKTAATTLTQNAWNKTGNLSADRVIDLSADSLGDANSRWLAVVWEYQVFTAADSVVISSLTDAGAFNWGLGGNLLLNTGSYAIVSNRGAVVALECDDGTFAFLRNACVFSNLATASVASNAAIRRAGVKFKFPTQRKINSFGFYFSTLPNGSDGRLVLYDSDGTTELVSVDIDNDAVSVTANRAAEIEFSPVTLAADTYYRFVFVAGTITALAIAYGDVSEVGLMDGCILGQDAHWTQHDGSAWADTTTRRPFFALGVSAVHDGPAGGIKLAGRGGLAG